MAKIFVIMMTSLFILSGCEMSTQKDMPQKTQKETPVPQDQKSVKDKADILQFVEMNKVTTNDNGKALYKDDDILLDGSHIKSAKVKTQNMGNGEKDYSLSISFDEKGKKIFADVTEKLAKNLGQLAIIYKGEIISSPIVHVAITDGSATISFPSSFYDEAKELADKLNKKTKAEQEEK